MGNENVFVFVCREAYTISVQCASTNLLPGYKQLKIFFFLFCDALFFQPHYAPYFVVFYVSICHTVQLDFRFFIRFYTYTVMWLCEIWIERCENWMNTHNFCSNTTIASHEFFIEWTLWWYAALNMYELQQKKQNHKTYRKSIHVGDVCFLNGMEVEPSVAFRLVAVFYLTST